MIRYPRPLCIGDTIAVTAPSNGVVRLERLDQVIANLRMQGYQVVEGKCLRGNRKGASAPAQERAAELMQFLCDDTISAVFPPCGGALAIETLPLIDFDKLSSVRPKWMLGFSDISTILLPLTLLSGWANAHGTVLMGLPPDQPDAFASQTLTVLRTTYDATVAQSSSTEHQFPNYNTNPVSYIPGTTRWKALGANRDTKVHMKGRLIGGCLDTITWLVGTKYADIPAFVAKNQIDGVILYLENGGLRPTEFASAMLSIKLNGWFDSLAGVMLGRHCGPDGEEPEQLQFIDVLNAHIGDLPCPVLFDADLGHTLPQLTLINGAIAEINAENGSATVSQRFS